MTRQELTEAENVTRSIARWGSIAAVAVLGIGFVTDDTLSWDVISSNGVVIALVGVMFVGYALAWTPRYEVTGSLITLAAMLAICAYNLGVISKSPDYFPLAVGIPALFHLIAVALHRSATTRPKPQ